MHHIVDTIDEAEKDFCNLIDKGNDIITSSISKLKPGQMEFPGLC